MRVLFMRASMSFSAEFLGQQMGQHASQIPADPSGTRFAENRLKACPRSPADPPVRATKPKVTGSNPVWRIEVIPLGGRFTGRSPKRRSPTSSCGGAWRWTRSSMRSLLSAAHHRSLNLEDIVIATIDEIVLPRLRALAGQ